MIDFSRLDSRTAVHCCTLYQAIGFFEELSDQFPKRTRNWGCGIDDVKDSYEDYEEDFCFSIDMTGDGLLMCSDKDYYENVGYTVIEFEDLIETDVVYVDIEDIAAIL